MAQLNDAQLLAFFEQYLPNNDNELITPSILRLSLAQLVEAKVSADVLVQFAKLASPRFTGVPQVPTAPAGTNSDQVASTAFVQATLLAIAGGKNLSELTLPQDVQGGNWYLTSNGIWEARRSFNAQVAPVNGPNWRLLAGFAGQLTTLPVANLSDATDAGRAMLTAPSRAAQRALVNNPQIRAGQYGNHPGFDTEDGPAGSWAWVIQAIVTLMGSPTTGTGAIVQRPPAPTAGQVDDRGDTFGFLPNADYPSFAQYKVAGLPNTTGAEWLSPANSYVQNGRVYVRVVGAVDKGGLAVYVGASGSIPDGRVLSNDTAFTANNVVPTMPGALTLTFTVDNATLSPGDLLTFTARASGGTAPYQHSVQAFDQATGTVTPLGAASTPNFIGAWDKVPAGVYLVTDAVTDAAGASLVSDTRRVVVAAAGGGGGVLVPATRTRLGGVRIGEGLEVDGDGLLSVADDPRLGSTTAADPAAPLSQLVWQLLGDPGNRNASLGEFDASNTLGDFPFQNTFGANVYACTFGDGLANNVFANTQINITTGQYFFGNVLGVECSNCRFGDFNGYNELGAQVQILTTGNACTGNVFAPSVKYVHLGDGVKDCTIGAGCNAVRLGNYCERVELYNCGSGDNSYPFEIPAGTKDAVYRNNVLQPTSTVPGGGASYTDTQARAAQLNRTAPANTTTVTLTAGSPIDYGTAASGSFTVDGTSCVVGKEAYFNIGPGGSAPVFATAPQGQPFDTALAVFVPSKLNRYALRVFADRIEVLNLAN